MEAEVSRFAGAIGRVLWGALSVHSVITGVTLGLVLLIGNGVLLYAGAGALATPFTQIVLALGLARFVLNGQFGEWEGTLFSGVGGSWTTVLAVAGRYLLLTFLWLVPLLLLGLRVDQAAMGPAMMDNKSFALVLIYLFGSALTPPLFLIASVTAQDFGELFSPDHWRALFGGRSVDLVSIYAIYAGGIAVALLISFPVVALAFMPSWKLGLLALAIAGCFVTGLAINLLGRLCGFFALGEFDAEVEPEVVRPPDAEPLATRPTDLAPPTPRTISPSPVPLPLVREPPSQPVAADAPQKPQASPAPGGLPALLEASDRIQQIMKRYETDPEGALNALADLRQAFAPHPQVLVALCVCQHRSGQIGEAVELAQDVLPLCFQRGHVMLAAQVFKQLRHQVDQLGLNREQVLTIGDGLIKKGDLAGAGAAYSTAIGRDRGEMRAVKGLLQVAETYLNQRSKPAAAAKVYDYLIKHCSNSPLAEFMFEGIEKCRRRSAQPVG